MRFRVGRSPLRVSIAGGGTDIPSYYENYGGAVVSFAINKYVYVVIKEISTLFPYRFKLAYSITELCNNVEEIKHPIIKAVVRKYNLSSLDMASMADIPAGTGLGSSSAFTAALIKAIFPSISKYSLAEAVCEIELDILKEPIGKQDQYATVFGGINHIRFSSTGIDVNPLRSPEYALEDACSLYYLGRTRSASAALKSQTINTTEAFRHLPFLAKKAVIKGDWKKLGDIVSQGWNIKRSQGKNVSNKKIDRAISALLKGGAYGAKLLGAGGAGFILAISENRRTVINLPQIHFSIDHEGTKII